MERPDDWEFGAATRIGLIGDTHDLVVGHDVFERVRPELRDVELILHCGDVSTLEGLATLASIAPVVAVRSTTDPEASPPTLMEGPRRVVASGYRIELRNKLPDDEVVERDDVDLVVFSAHTPRLSSIGETLYLSPGSPAISDSPSLAVLELVGGRAVAQFRLLSPKANPN